MHDRVLWFSLLAPAYVGEAASALAAVERAQTPDAQAVAARALWILGHQSAARRMADQASRAVGPEVDALAMMLDRSRLDLAARRLETARSPGEQADIWCDVAALQFQAGRWEPGIEAVSQARTACPDHGEALRWERYAQSEHRARIGTRSAIVPERKRPESADPAALSPRREQGWLSRERLRRRLAVFDHRVRSVAGTALARLIDAGAAKLYFASARDYANMYADNAMVSLELAADLVLSLREEGRRDVHAVATVLRLAHERGGRCVADAERLLGLSAAPVPPPPRSLRRSSGIDLQI